MALIRIYLLVLPKSIQERMCWLQGTHRQLHLQAHYHP